LAVGVDNYEGWWMVSWFIADTFFCSIAG